MTASANLNWSKYTSVWNDNFSTQGMPNPNIFTEKWGNADDFSTANSELTLTSYASENWAAVGFLQPDFGPSSSQGYGLYSATFSMNANQGTGPAIVMWPVNNIWPGPEIDLVEDWSDPTRQTGYATIHWEGANDSNQYQTYTFHANMTRPTTAAMDWEAGSLTFFINGKAVFQYTGAHVPVDYAQGGLNEAFGAEVTSAGSDPSSSSVSLHMYDMSYSTLNVGSKVAALTPADIGATATPALIGSGSGSASPAQEPAITPAEGDATFTFESVNGKEVINNFVSSDTLDLASSLRSSVKETITSAGLLLTFGSSSNSILLSGVSSLAGNQIQYI